MASRGLPCIRRAAYHLCHHRCRTDHAITSVANKCTGSTRPRRQNRTECCECLAATALIVIDCDCHFTQTQPARTSAPPARPAAVVARDVMQAGWIVRESRPGNAGRRHAHKGRSVKQRADRTLFANSPHRLRHQRGNSDLADVVREAHRFGRQDRVRNGHGLDWRGCDPRHCTA
jgi:hypothetical protein